MPFLRAFVQSRNANGLVQNILQWLPLCYSCLYVLYVTFLLNAQILHIDYWQKCQRVLLWSKVEHKYTKLWSCKFLGTSSLIFNKVQRYLNLKPKWWSIHKSYYFYGSRYMLIYNWVLQDRLALQFIICLFYVLWTSIDLMMKMISLHFPKKPRTKWYSTKSMY